MHCALDLSQDNTQLIPCILENIYMLRNQNSVVQAQPIGMIRIALQNQPNATGGFFLHIWMPGLPMQATGGPFAHTHVFHLRSKILKGKIKNIIYTPVSTPNGSHKLVKAICEQDYCSLEQRDIMDRVEMSIVETKTIRAGEIYEVAKDTFHETVIDNSNIVVTIMEKLNIDNRSPIAAIPYHLPISSELFDRNQLDQNTIWKQVITLLEAI